jgi:hypothetical protein
VIDLVKNTISIDNCTVSIAELSAADGGNSSGGAGAGAGAGVGAGAGTFRKTFAEFHAFGISQQLFDQIDLDHSGTVSASEFRASVTRLAKWLNAGPI